MSSALVTTSAPVAKWQSSLPPVPWRDPHTVSPVELSAYIQRLEKACLDNPQSADLRTCLGMAYAVNYDVYKSMDALEDAKAIDPEHFWAQFKYGELHYRLRVVQAGLFERLNVRRECRWRDRVWVSSGHWRKRRGRSARQRRRVCGDECVGHVL